MQREKSKTTVSKKIGFAMVGGVMGIAMLFGALAILFCVFMILVALSIAYTVAPTITSILTFVFILGAGIFYYNYERLVE